MASAPLVSAAESEFLVVVTSFREGTELSLLRRLDLLLQGHDDLCGAAGLLLMVGSAEADSEGLARLREPQRSSFVGVPDRE